MMIEKKLIQLSEDIVIPDPLKPDQIEQKLQHAKAGRQSRYARRFTTRLALGAACLLLVAAVGNYLLAAGILNITPDSNPQHNSSPQADSDTVAASPTQTPEEAAAPEGEIYETLRQKIALSMESSGFGQYQDTTTDTAVENSEEVADASGSSGSTQKEANNEYSDTNLQVQNVDEGDVVKTDGTYIYTSAADTFGSTVCIYKAEGKDTKKLTELTVDSMNISEMYIKDHFLVLVGSDWEKQPAKEKLSGAYTEQNIQPENTLVLVYDIADIKKPKQTFRKTQSGTYSSSRINGNYLYTFSVMYAVSADKKDKRECYIPSVGGSLVPEDRLIIPSDVTSSAYIVLTSLDIMGGDDFSDTLSILGGDGICYASEENIYIASLTADYTKTTISRFHYQDGKLKENGEKTFRGKILNQFSMDEYEGKLRFVATTEHTGWFTSSISNGLYVLDENMELLGKVDRLAKSERIYSARFMGDKAYFVTYRETDPVFLVDLSDPSNPIVKDKLKIPGFSEYLQSYGEGLLLGIGSNIDKNGDTQVKLTMFDISSGTNVHEIHTKLLENETYSLAGKNHKAILADAGKNLIGFAAESYEKNGKQKITYRLYSYDEKKGFQKLATLSPKNMEISSVRGLYIGEHLYLADGEGIGGIYVYDLNTGSQLAKITK